MKVSSDIFNLCLYDIHRIQKAMDLVDMLPDWDSETINQENIYTNLLSLFLYRLAVDPGFFAAIIPNIRDSSITEKTVERINTLKYNWTRPTTDGCFSKNYLVDDEGATEKIVAEVSRLYEAGVSNMLYPARNKVNPWFLEHVFNNAKKSNNIQVQNIACALFVQNNSFDIWDMVPYHLTFGKDMGEIWRYDAKWLEFFYEHITYGRFNYLTLSPLNAAAKSINPDDISEEITKRRVQSIKKASQSDVPSLSIKEEKLHYIYDHKLIYLSPFVKDLRDEFAKIQNFESSNLLTSREFGQLSDEKKQAYQLYVMFTTDALTIACELWFNDLYSENQSLALKILNTEYELKIEDAVKWLGENTVHQLLWIVLQLKRSGYYHDAEVLCRFCLNREDKTDADSFYCNLFLAELESRDGNSKKDLEKAVRNVKNARELIRGYSRKPLKYSGDFDNYFFGPDYWSTYTEYLHDDILYYAGKAKRRAKYLMDRLHSFTSFADQIEMCYSLSKAARRFQNPKDELFALKCIVNSPGFKEIPQKDKLMYGWEDIERRYNFLLALSLDNSLSSPHLSAIQSREDNVQRFNLYIDQSKILSEEFQYSRSRLCLTACLSLSPENNQHLRVACNTWLFNDDLELENYNSAYDSSLVLRDFPATNSMFAMMPGIILVLNKNIVDGIRNLKTTLERLLLDDIQTQDDKRQHFDRFIIFSVVYTLSIPRNNGAICHIICDELCNVLQKNIHESDALLWISDAFSSLHWFSKALNWFNGNPEEHVSDDNIKSRILFAKGSFYKRRGNLDDALFVFTDLLTSQYYSEEHRSDLIKLMAEIYEDTHDYVNALNYRKELLDTGSNDISKALSEHLEQYLSTESVHSEYARSIFIRAESESLKIISSGDPGVLVDCTLAFGNYGLGLESYLYSMIGEKARFEVLSHFNKGIKEDIFKRLKGWRNVLSRNREGSPSLDGWSKLSDDIFWQDLKERGLKYNKPNSVLKYLYNFILNTFGRDIIESVTNSASFLKVYRNQAFHGLKPIMMTYQEFCDAHEKTIQLLNNLIGLFSEKEI